MQFIRPRATLPPEGTGDGIVEDRCKEGEARGEEIELLPYGEDGVERTRSWSWFGGHSRWLWYGWEVQCALVDGEVTVPEEGRGIDEVDGEGLDSC